MNVTVISDLPMIPAQFCGKLKSGADRRHLGGAEVPTWGVPLNSQSGRMAFRERLRSDNSVKKPGGSQSASDNLIEPSFQGTPYPFCFLKN